MDRTDTARRQQIYPINSETAASHFSHISGTVSGTDLTDTLHGSLPTHLLPSTVERPRPSTFRFMSAARKREHAQQR